MNHLSFTCKPSLLRCKLAVTLCLATCLTPFFQARADFLTTEELGAAGATRYDGWSYLSDSYYFGYPNFSNANNPWPAPITANLAGSNGAKFNKVSGPAYPSSASIYSPFAVSELTVYSQSALAGLQSVIFQIDIGTGATTDFEVLPTLNYNGGTQALAFSFRGVADELDGGSYEGIDIDRNEWVFQWDLSGLGETISSFSVNWSVGAHAQTYKLQLNQSDTYTPLTVPEPASVALLAAGLFVIAVCRFREPSFPASRNS